MWWTTNISYHSPYQCDENWVTPNSNFWHAISSCRPTQWPFFFGLILPFVLVYLFNWVMFVIILASILRHTHKHAATSGDKGSKLRAIRQKVVIALTLSLHGVWLGVGAGATGDEHTSDRNHNWVPSHLHSVRRSTRLADADIPWLPQWEGQGGVEAVAQLCHLQAQESIRFWSKYVGHHETVDVLRHKEVCPLNLHCFLQPRHYHLN